MIELRNIHKSYATSAGKLTALEAIDLKVEPGQIFGVIGRSGAGKSTLIRCVNLLERPDRGEVIVDGENLLALSAAALRAKRHKIGMVFQHFNLLSTRTVFDNIALPLQLLKYSKAEIKKTIGPLLELIGLSDRQRAYPSQLSGGQKQRVAIARALATKPKVLLCDEMTSALDPETTRSILKLIQNINAEFSLSMLLITHEMQVIKSIADKVAVIDQGKIVECDEVMNVFCNPQTEVTKALVHDAIDPELPLPLQNKLQAEPIAGGKLILRVSFIGQSARRPIIDDLIRHHNVEVNILCANLELLNHDTLGVMLVALGGKFNKALDYFQQHQIKIEVLGYVPTDDWPIN